MEDIYLQESVFSKELEEATELYQKQQSVNPINALEYYYQLKNNDYDIFYFIINIYFYK